MTGNGLRAPVVVAVGHGIARSDALDWAAAEAAARGSPLRVVHAFPCRLAIDPYGLLPAIDGPPTAPAVAEELVRAALEQARSVAPDVELSGSVCAGAPVRVLLEQSRHAALLVLGGRGVDTRKGPRPGVTFARMAARARCPVVLIRSRLRVRSGPSRPRVVVGVDAARSRIPAVGFAFQAAAQRGIPLAAVHAWVRDAPADLEAVCGSTSESEAAAGRPSIGFSTTGAPCSRTCSSNAIWCAATRQRC